MPKTRPLIHRNSGSTWLNWTALDAIQTTLPASSSHLPRRSATGWLKPAVMTAVAATA